MSVGEKKGGVLVWCHISVDVSLWVVLREGRSGRAV